MTLPVVWRPIARAEFDDAGDRYEQRSAGLGARFTRAVQDVLDRIASLPGLYAPIYQDVRCGPVRRFPFVVLYRVLPDRILVIGVVPSKSDPAVWQSRV
jgi:toxin ParE1/3/4